MTLELKDLLIEKPVCLIVWTLKDSFKQIYQYFLENGFEIKVIESEPELEAWLKVEMVRVIILAGETLEEIKDFKIQIDRLPIERRRQIFLIYILSSEKTLDPERTFLLSANLLINKKDLEFFKKIYSKASLYWEILYKNYYKVLERFSEEVLGL